MQIGLNSLDNFPGIKPVTLNPESEQKQSGAQSVHRNGIPLLL